MKKIILLSLVAPLLSACVGVGIKYNHTAMTNTASLSDKRARLIEATNNVQTATKKDVLQYWGQPDAIETNRGKERWIYNDGLRWNGIVFIAIIPIPLVLPVGHDYVALTFDEESLVSVETKAQNSAGAWCPALQNVHTLEMKLCDAEVDEKPNVIPPVFFDRSAQKKAIGITKQ